jgi:RNA polymerase I-specific transcription initiation factor RRN3
VNKEAHFLFKNMAPLPMAAPNLSPSLPTLKTNSTKLIRPLLRHATVGRNIRTRDEAGLDVDDSAPSAPPSLNKRARTVTFSPVIEEQVFSSSAAMAGFAPDGSARDLENIREEVRFVVEERAKGANGNNEGYDALREVFAPGKLRDGNARQEASSEQVKMHLLALTNCVGLLGKNCSSLVKAVLECEWMGRNEAFVKVYVHFLGNLASAQGAYVGIVLGMLVGKFIGGE